MTSFNTIEEAEHPTTTMEEPIPNIVPMSETSPPSLITATQTNQQNTTVDVDDGSMDNSIQSTNPLQMVIPKPLPTLASFWAWAEAEFQPFYSDELNEIIMVQMGIISFQKMVEFFAEEPHQQMIQVLGYEQFNHYRQSLVDLAIIWEYAQTLMNSGGNMFSPTYGNFINFRHQWSKFFQ